MSKMFGVLVVFGDMGSVAYIKLKKFLAKENKDFELITVNNSPEIIANQIMN